MNDAEPPPLPGTAAPPTDPASTARLIVRNVLVILCVLAVLYLVYLLRRPLGWLALATFLAVALSGPVNLLGRYMRRGFAIALTYVGVMLVPVLLALIVVPPFVDQGTELVQDFPAYVQDIEQFVSDNKTLHQLDEKYDIVSKLQEKADELPGRIGDAAQLLSDLGLGIVNSGFAMLNILILSIFLLGSGPTWAARLVAIQPDHRRERLDKTLRDMANAVGNYIGGALLQATIAAILTYIVLTILGIPFAAPLAIIVGAFDLIPLIGATIGAVIVALVTLFVDFPTATILWVIWSVVYQQLENNVIQPQIQRRAVDIHPLVVIMAVLCGSTLFGVLGALLAIPVAASIQIAVLEFLTFRDESRLLTLLGAQPLGPQGEDRTGPDHEPPPAAA
ncbi:AI-2E family transporter [Paraconexibacter sp.]|uniref:AI-2E family transporter n=1 Tax=Paraconexibacter sp. TaxID=2949640 RepID=UPI00356433B5